jgi:hypothetical protein
MKINILYILILLSFSNILVAQKFCTEHNYFVDGCISISGDSFVYEKDGDFNNFQIQGVLKRIEDTLIINPGVKADSITIVKTITSENNTNSIQIEIVDEQLNRLNLYESWTNYPLEYCCVFNNGFLETEEIPLYDTIMVNPFGARQYAIYLPIKGKLNIGNNYTFVIKEPTVYLEFFAMEIWFLRKGTKLIQLDKNKNITDIKWKKNGR